MVCAAFTALAISGCTGNSSNLLGGSAALTPGQPLNPAHLGSRFHIGHLYVADGYRTRNRFKVYEFPLVNGIVSSKPDAVLNVATPHGSSKQLLSLAIDPSGNLAVLLDAVAEPVANGQLDIYPPGATGDAPPSSVLLSGSCSEFGGSVAFDAASNIYIGGGKCGSGVGYSVYAAGATGHASPIAYLPMPDGINWLSLSGPLLYLWTGYSIVAYKSPLSDPIAIHSWCLPTPPRGARFYWQFNGPFVIDAASARLFVPQTTYKNSRIGIYPLNKSRCPVVTNKAARVAVSETTFVPSYLAFHNNYLFVGGTAGGASVTYQIKSRSGPQTPVATLHRLGPMVVGP